MKVIIFRPFLVFLILFSFVQSYAQDNKLEKNYPEMKKNTVYGTVGTLPGFWGVINVNYERLISERKKGFFRSYWLRTGAGLYAEWGSEGGHFVTGLTALTGSNKNHLELNIGFALLFPNFPYEYAGPHPLIINPAGVIGYRFQKPQGKFVFRFGVGYPEAWYLSLGLVF